MIDRFLKTFRRLLILCGVVIVGYVALAAYVFPESTNVSSNIDGQAPMTTRTLDPKAAPTTTAHTLTSGPQRATRPTTTTPPAHGDDYVVIDGTHVIYVPRNSTTAYYLFLATRIMETK